MNQDDCLLAIERHATSKISSVDDLRHITTMGFRGEALPSIAAVGRFTLESWDGEAASGTRVLMDNGKLITVEPVGRAQGTTVTLDGLFRKLPARRKFLRTRETETAWCLGAVEDAALANPAVSFVVTSDGASALDLPPASSLQDRVASLWGVETAEGLIPLSGSADGVVLEGLVSPPTVTFGRRTRHKIIVNGRPVRDPVLNRVISSALAGSWPAGRFPALALLLTVDDDLVDVNVHPAKREVRFRRTDPITNALRSAVSTMKEPVKASPAYTREISRRGLSGTQSPVSDIQVSSAAPSAAKDIKLPFGSTSESPTATDVVDKQTAAAASIAASTATTKLVLGQVMGTYIVLEGENGLEVVDQHAAHERIVFNRLMARRAGRGVPVQRLVVPLVLTLSPSEARNLLASAELLNSFGFEVDEFGTATIRVTAVPSDLKERLIEELLRQLAADPDSLGKDPEEVALAVSRWACRESIMAGQKLSTEEMSALIRELDEAESGFSCPHGRPTRVILGSEDLEKLFGRR